MAKIDIKQYLESRIKALLIELDTSTEIESIIVSGKIRELLDVASHFGCKMKTALNSHPLGKQFKQ
jgi:hypothetical protein